MQLFYFQHLNIFSFIFSERKFSGPSVRASSIVHKRCVDFTILSFLFIDSTETACCLNSPRNLNKCVRREWKWRHCLAFNLSQKCIQMIPIPRQRNVLISLEIGLMTKDVFISHCLYWLKFVNNSENLLNVLILLS